MNRTTDSGVLHEILARLERLEHSQSSSHGAAAPLVGMEESDGATFRTGAGGCRIVLRVMDITTYEGDAIVNAANKQLIGGGGVCGAIYQAAGHKELTAACNAIPALFRADRCPTGDARVTPGFNLKAKYIVHAVGPDLREVGGDRAPALLTKAYTSALDRGLETGSIRSIAFPAISTGIYGYPLYDAAEVALDAVASHPRLAEFEEVCFALYDSRALAAFWRALQSIQLPLPKVDVSTLVITEPAIIERIPRREASTQTEDLPDLGGDPRGTARLSGSPAVMLRDGPRFPSASHGHGPRDPRDAGSAKSAKTGTRTEGEAQAPKISRWARRRRVRKERRAAAAAEKAAAAAAARVLEQEPLSGTNIGASESTGSRAFCQEPFDKGVAQVVPPSPERVGAAPRDQARSRLAILTTPQVRPAWGYATSLPDNSTDLLPLVLVPESVNPPGPEMPLINWAEAEEDTGEGEVDLSIAKETPETVRRRGGFGEGSSYASLTSDATESDSEEGQSDQNASPKAFDEEDSFGGGTYWE